jgi:hypothetical protein
MTRYSKDRYRGLNYIEEHLAKSIDEITQTIKDELKIQLVYFEPKPAKKYGITRMGYFPHISEGSTSRVSSWKEVNGKKLVYIKQMLKNKQFYGMRNINGQSCKVRFKQKKINQ